MHGLRWERFAPGDVRVIAAASFSNSVRIAQDRARLAGRLVLRNAPGPAQAGPDEAAGPDQAAAPDQAAGLNFQILMMEWPQLQSQMLSLQQFRCTGGVAGAEARAEARPEGKANPDDSEPAAVPVHKGRGRGRGGQASDSDPNAEERRRQWEKRFRPLPPLLAGVVLGCLKCKKKPQGCRTCRARAGYPVPADW